MDTKCVNCGEVIPKGYLTCGACQHHLPFTKASPARPSTELAVGWRRGWKWRVYAWAIGLAAIGLLFGSNSDLQAKLGVSGLLAFAGSFLGWFIGAVVGLVIERSRSSS